MVMRKAATSLGEKTLIPASSFSPRFIRKNELPQVRASRKTTNKWAGFARFTLFEILAEIKDVTAVTFLLLARLDTN